MILLFQYINKIESMYTKATLDGDKLIIKINKESNFHLECGLSPNNCNR